MNTENILEIRNLTTVFRQERTETVAVDGISFSLKIGETLGIVGESGSGKSVTALSILGLIDTPQGLIKNGKIIFYDPSPSPPLEGEESGVGRSVPNQVLSGKNSVNLLTLNEKQLQSIRGKEIAMIFQEPMTSLNPVFTCGLQVKEVLRKHLGMGRKESKKRTIELFQEVDLPRPEELLHSYPHQLSGGQKQRVMIAMAMACNPKILIADEPTTALDVTVQKTILDLMKRLRQKHGMSIIFITHDLGLVSDFADRILVMYKGKIVEQGNIAEVFQNPQHPYTKGLLSCRPPSGVRIRKLSTVDDYMTGNQAYLNLSTQNLVSQEERKTNHEKLYSHTPILEVKEINTLFPLSYSFFGKVRKRLHAVNNVSFSVYPGETLGIVGESGCGKTTLGRTILQLVKASSGQVRFDGEELTLMDNHHLREVRKNLQLIFQDPYSSLNPRIMVGTAITEPMKVHGLYGDSSARKSKAIELLQKVGLDENHFYRYPHEFSGGQRQRISIARALALIPKLIICDESVSALDVSVQAQVLNLLNDLKREFNFTYLFISHDLSVVRFMSDRLIVMNAGRIEETGEADEIYSNPKSEYTRKLLSALPGYTRQ